MKVPSTVDVNSPQFIEKLLEKINDKVLDDLKKDILREERDNLQDERKTSGASRKRGFLFTVGQNRLRIQVL
ncbi:MAG: hypothetical protein ACTSRG_00005 [Candidatus Helarchaeota archaeon]